jgi:hypothetical protein
LPGDGGVGQINRHAVMQVRVKQRAFTRQKLNPQNHDGIILQNQLMVRLCFHRNRRLLRGK